MCLSIQLGMCRKLCLSHGSLKHQYISVDELTSIYKTKMDLKQNDMIYRTAIGQAVWCLFWGLLFWYFLIRVKWQQLTWRLDYNTGIWS